MSMQEIEERLAAARQRLEKALDPLGGKWQGREYQEYWAAHEAVLALERELAAARNEEYAVPVDFPVKWDPGCPLPHLLCNDRKTLLAFILREDDPAWDGSSVEVVSLSDERPMPLALVEFISCATARLGSPNDEVFHGHPLEGRGRGAYAAQRVVNSRWMAEIQAINKVHPRYNPASRWEGNHYIFWFHDSIFECIAESFTVEVYRESMTAMLARMCQRLLS